MQAAAYGKPIYITENGVPDHDDDVRPRFLATHLAETRARHRRRRGCARLLSLDTGGQLRVGGRVEPAVRAVRDRPGDGNPHPAHQRRGLQPDGAREWGAGQPAGEGRRRGMAGNSKLELEAGNGKSWQAAGVSTPAGQAVSFQFPDSSFQFAHFIPDMLYSEPLGP